VFVFMFGVEIVKRMRITLCQHGALPFGGNEWPEAAWLSLLQYVVVHAPGRLTRSARSALR
jgi:hypothetical protein